MSGSDQTHDSMSRAELVSLIATAIAPLVQNQIEATKSLMETMHEIKSGQELTNERMKRVVMTVDTHEHLLRGNGNIGLLTRVAQIESQNRSHSEDLEHLVGTVRGEDDRQGLVGRVTHLEAKAEGLARPMWIVLSALLSSGVTLIITNLLK